MEQAEFTNMCMILDGDNVLIQERPGPTWPGVAFPGGHVEHAEPFVDSVIREVREETGLTIQDPVLRGVKNWFSEGRRYIVFLYEAHTFSGALTSSDEGPVRWVPLSSLRSLPLASGMEDTLAFYESSSGSEIFYDASQDHWTMRVM